MSALESVLVLMVVVWTVVFIGVGIGIFYILYQVKKAIDKLNNILQATENMANNVEAPLKFAASKLINYFFKKKGESKK